MSKDPKGQRALYCDVLGVPVDATPAEIRNAYVRRAKILHPDLHANSTQSKIAFQLLNDAYQYLKSHKYEARAYEPKPETAAPIQHVKTPKWYGQFALGAISMWVAMMLVGGLLRAQPEPPIEPVAVKCPEPTLAPVPRDIPTCRPVRPVAYIDLSGHDMKTALCTSALIYRLEDLLNIPPLPEVKVIHEGPLTRNIASLSRQLRKQFAEEQKRTEVFAKDLSKYCGR
jgi:hypothetical protein